MKNNIIIGLVCCALGYILAVYTFKFEDKGPTISTASTAKTDKTTKKAVKTVITEKKNGDKVTIIEDNSTISKAKEEKRESKTELPPTKPRYSLGLNVYRPLRQELRSFELEAGYRIIGNIWGTGAYNLNTKDYSLGLRVEF